MMMMTTKTPPRMRWAIKRPRVLLPPPTNYGFGVVTLLQPCLQMVETTSWDATASDKPLYLDRSLPIGR